MKEWIVLQGWPLYLMLGMTGLGLLGSILSRIFYGRLAREAQLCGTSDYPMLHYIRQKYSSYYKLGMRPGNAEALVKRYLALHRVGPLALYSWNEAGNFMMGAVMLTGLIRGIYRFQTTMQTGPALMDIGIGLVLALGLRLTGKIFSVERLQVITLNAICDYLENYLKSKLDFHHQIIISIEQKCNHNTLQQKTGNLPRLFPEYHHCCTSDIIRR